jgi:hypothetical protein
LQRLAATSSSPRFDAVPTGRSSSQLRIVLTDEPRFTYLLDLDVPLRVQPQVVVERRAVGAVVVGGVRAPEGAIDQMIQ